ncbi:hypothetical protein FRC06_003417 [Ceratobasidium sp. 370]|nr:hypothetical protein FRC06_003417 [Ceratobasidium sp. 370]
MSRVPAALAYLVIYNPTLQPNPDDSVEGRDEDDVTEQAHILFYTARERAVSRDRILRQVGLAKALANFAEMFTSQPGFDNVHAQKSRLVMISPEPNFWIHACVDLAKTPKPPATKSTPGTDVPEDFDYHSNSLNDDILRTQLMQAFQTFKLQYGGFCQIMQSEGIRALERRIESFFTPWAWQWNLDATPEFGAYLGLPIHPLKTQLSAHIDEYVSHVSDTPTLILSPPHIITTSALTSISPLPPLVRFLERLVPPPKPKSPPPPPPPASDSGTSTPKHMLVAGGHAVTKYITKPAAQVVDPRNWSWPTYMTFGKGSLRGKDKERSKIPAIDTSVEETPNTADEKPLKDNKQGEFLGVPVDQDAVSKASRSVSPSTIDHESLLEAQQDPRLDIPEPNVDVPGLLVASVVNEDHEGVWRNAAPELLFSLNETIQSRQLTAAETTLRALNTTKVIAHYPASQMSASSVLPQFTSDSPQLFIAARALQFSTAPNIREIVTQTRWGTWCAARQSTPGTRLYVEIDRKEANLVDVDHELGSACRRWEDTDA